MKLGQRSNCLAPRQTVEWARKPLRSAQREHRRGSGMLRRKLNGCLHALAGVLLAGVASTAAHAAAPAATNAQFTVYGFVQADYIYDFKRVDPAWQDTLRPSRIPTVDGIFGSN